MKTLIFAGTLASIFATTAAAKVIETACNRSDRQDSNRAVCGCIQDAANLTLDKSDQKLAATFFRNPERAQVIRQSETSRNERFWERYEQFGVTAQEFCSTG